jgi:hypothetical protein
MSHKEKGFLTECNNLKDQKSVEEIISKIFWRIYLSMAMGVCLRLRTTQSEWHL